MTSDDPIPIYTTLSTLYDSLGTSLNHAERWSNLANEFHRRFGRKPAWIARAPGRVNIIGEHIDYCLFGVLPAAVEQDILIACAPRHEKESGSVVAENLHDKYPKQTFVPVRRQSVSEEDVHVEEWHMDINTRELRWESYVKAGYFGVLNHYFPPGSSTTPVPVDLLVTGTVPAGSGLSSSAAMVVASTLAFLAVNGKLTEVTKHTLVSMAVENEKRVGVNSGGMDQAASVTSIPSSALYTSFYPSFSTSPVPLPPGYVLVVANSLVVSDKAVTAKTNYNLRVVETLVAARVLARHLDISLKHPKEKIRLREVLGRWLGEDETTGELSPELLEEGLMNILEGLDCLLPADKTNNVEGHTPPGLKKEEMIHKTGMTPEEFEEVYLSWVEIEATEFKLWKRAHHVFSESLRVLQFRKTCLQASSSGGEWTEETISTLGELMTTSHTSCAINCESSCPEVDSLVRVCLGAGAKGSRVTGAGWGGCTVSLVAEDKAHEFIRDVVEGYPPFKEMRDAGKEEELREAIFVTKPSVGACVYKVED